jgi:hypothetical protein
MIKKWFFGSVPKSPTQMGSLSVKNASEKFSRLGTFNGKVKIWCCYITVDSAITALQNGACTYQCIS